MPYIKALKPTKYLLLTFSDYRSKESQDKILSIKKKLEILGSTDINKILDVAFSSGLKYRSMHIEQTSPGVRHYMGHHSPCAAIPK